MSNGVKHGRVAQEARVSLPTISLWGVFCEGINSYVWRRQTKSSPIFAKILQLVFSGTLSSELFEFLRYLYPSQRYAKFSFSGFFNSARLFGNIFSRKLVFKVLFMLNSDPLKFLRYLLPFKRYEWKHLFIFNSAWPQCEVFLANFRLLLV